MRVADGLLILKDMNEEVARLRALSKTEGWEYRTMEKDAKWQPTFDLEANMKAVKELTKKARKLNRAISVANQTTSLPEINDADYSEWV